MESELFKGDAHFLGGLSNEKELTKQCPDKFKENNPWSDYANEIFFNGAKTHNWKFKDADKETQTKQLFCLKGLLGTFGIPHEDKGAVAGWMLSEMLSEVPEKTKET